MNRKTVTILGVYLIIGVGLIMVGQLTDFDYYSSMMFGMGVGLCSAAVANLFREYRNTRPENREAYEQKLRQQRINLKDERKVFLRYKAGYRMYQLTTMICFFASAVLALFRVNSMIITALFLTAIGEYAVGTILYKQYCRKM